MLLRHRTPTIFSIYMVDVLCCALGCVVLLWQVYHYESEEHSAATQAALGRLNDARLSLGSLTSDIDALKIQLQATKNREVQVTLLLDDTRSELDKTQKLALVFKKDYEEAKKAEALARGLISQLQGTLQDWQKKTQALTGDLAVQTKAKVDLTKQLADTLASLQGLEDDLKAKKAALTQAEKKWQEQQKQTEISQALAQELERTLGDSRVKIKASAAQMAALNIRSQTLEQALAQFKKDLAAAGLQVQDLVANKDNLLQKLTLTSQDLEDARLLLSSIKGENLNLLRKAQKIQFESLNRFAGITLTGQRVIFLLDMSGSMELIDENTFDPDKWPTVCETIGKIMKSLPDLKQYQVILFSDKFRYPFANERQWLSFTPESTPMKVVDGLKAIKPRGATNLYDAFQETFLFRDQGLDTVYLISDGLPTDGEGVSSSTTLTANQKTELLSKHLRQRLKSDWNRPIGNQPRVRIHTIGFFYESPDVGAFLWSLAREHDGGFVGMSKP